MSKTNFPHPSAPTIARETQVGTAPGAEIRSKALEPPVSAAGGDMDEDDICPICEDDCTCGNARSGAGDYAVDASSPAPVPLFAQIVNQHKPTAVFAAHDTEAVPIPPKKHKKPAQEPKSKPRKPRKQKGAEDKSLISRLVSAMGKSQTAAPTNDDEEEFDDSGMQMFADGAGISSSDGEGDVFVSAAGSEQSRVANSAALSLAAHMARPKGTKPGRTSKAAAASKPPSSWQKKKALEASRVRADDVEPALFEVNAAVINGRVKRVSPARRRMASPKLGAAGMAHEDEDDDEFINITDVTSDGSMGGALSETEFDQSRGLVGSGLHGEWSDSRILDDSDDEDIEQEDAAYLVHMQQGGYSSSSLSDLDEQRMATIGSGVTDSDLDSGAESDSETSDNGYRRHDKRRHKHSSRRRKRRGRTSDHGSGSLLVASGSELESDQELTFRSAQTEKEHALVSYGRSDDDREDELLKMHLEQMRAVHNVMQDCSGSLLEYAGAASNSEAESDGDIVFTYQSPSNGSDDLSDDLMEGWATDARKRWKDADGFSSDSSVSESKIDKLRLKEDDEQDRLYSSDSYDEFYTRSAFLDMASDDIDMLGADGYAPELDLDGASLALGVALSMEQQGYSKEDAAAAAAVAAAAYPNSSSGGGRPAEADGKPAQTTITASMNANGEADPIDGIVSIKSSSGRSGASRMATGTHTPFALSDWRVAAAASAAAAYLDSPKPPAVSYVLPKDLNEARSPRVAIAAAAAAAGASTDASDKAALENASDMARAEYAAAGLSGTMSPSMLSSTATTTAVPTSSSMSQHDGHSVLKAGAGPPRASRALSMSASGAFTSQLPNSSFYKPLSSICTPIRDTASGAVQQVIVTSASSSGAPAAGMPLVSLTEVNAALTALSDPIPFTPSTAVADVTSPLKRKVGGGFGTGLSVQPGSGDKRARRASETEVQAEASMTFDPPSLDLSSLFAGGGLAGASSLYDLNGMQAINSTLAMGAGTPIRGGYGSLRDEPASDDDWLLTMDQLVDTDALMVQSPPPSPAEGAGGVSDISDRLSLAAGASDPLARWDRIPVNIFRRSRALASSSRRHLAAQEGAMSSLAMTAIKSSRQRRALVNSTLLTQHTLSAEAALQQHAMKQALRGDRRGMQRSESAALLGMHMPPPAPPPTPLASRAMLHHTGLMPGTEGSLASISPSRTSRKDSQGVSSRRQSKALDFSARVADADDLRGRHRRLVSSGIVTDVGTPCEVLSAASDSSETVALGVGRRSASVAANDADGNGSDTGYAFGWLEDEEDLSLFTMPEIEEADDQQPSMTMLLASTSPMLMPLRSKSDIGSDRPV